MFDTIMKRKTGSSKSGEVEEFDNEVELENKKQNEIIDYKIEFPEPTQEDYATLPQVIGHPPYFAYLLCLMEFAERASFYCVKDLLSNFIQLSLPKGGNGTGAAPSGTQENAGALGLGLEAASGITLTLTFLCYTTPLWGGYISDKTLGRVKTIWYGIWVGGISHVILIFAAIPSVIKDSHKALAPLIISIILLAIATGLIKPNLLPLLLDQYEHKTDVVETRADGSRVIISREKSLERITLAFYWSINVGSFLSIGTGFAAKRNGFWLAFLIPGIIYFIMVPVLYLVAKRLKKETPNGVSIIQESIKVLKWSFHKGFYRRIKEKTFWEWAKPTNILMRGEVNCLDEVNPKGNLIITWTDQFVDDVRVTLSSSVIFLFFIIYNINDGGIGSIQNSQSNSLTTNGVPNTLFNNFNALTIIVFIPILNFGVYPLLRKYKIEFFPVYRIFFGFMLAALSQMAGAIIQWKVYETSPCGYYATDCDVGTGVSPITAWVEVVLYSSQAVSECFANTSSYEIAYTRAPDNMKGLVMAIILSMSALSAAVSSACTGALEDPNLIWPFAACAIAGAVIAVIFLYVYRNLHKTMEAERLIREERLRFENIAGREESISVQSINAVEKSESPRFEIKLKN